MRFVRHQAERDLQAKLERVQARLLDSEAAMKAIRGGEVDSILVDGPQGSQIFTLQSPGRALPNSGREDERGGSLPQRRWHYLVLQHAPGLDRRPASREAGGFSGDGASPSPPRGNDSSISS